MVLRRFLVLWFTIIGLQTVRRTAFLACVWQMTLQLMLHLLKRRELI